MKANDTPNAATSPAPPPRAVRLDGPWTLSFRDPETDELHEIPARVPGNVVGDLLRAGLVDDPYFGSNSVALRKWEFADWEYRTVFDAPTGARDGRAELVFDGIDTVADVFVNGQAVGHAENMVIAHRFPLDGALLRPAGNELRVRIQSSTNYARRFTPPAVATLNAAGNAEGLYLRRPPHTYGWDICPRIVGAGLWRECRVEVVRPERWTELYVHTIWVRDDVATVAMNWAFSSDRKTLAGYSARIAFDCGDHHFEAPETPLVFTSGGTWLEIPGARLWNPAGHGPQNLYDVTLELLRDGRVVDTLVERVGLRTIELWRDDVLDAHGGGRFEFVVNGRRTFIKGANWVPANAIHGEARERALQSIALWPELGCNMVRCWGGGVYEDDAFYDYCDEHGILVWQDFMFACERPPHDDAFLAQVAAEAEAVVKRLRNHPSLAVWSGDNEGDGGHFYPPFAGRWMPSENRVTREVLPRQVYLHDPARDYMPSSPFVSDACARTGDATRSPEQHLWGFRDSWKDRYYAENKAVFASEIGYHGMTDVRSVARFIPKAEFNDRHGPAWTTHASQPFGQLTGGWAGRNRLMERQARNFWGYIADDLDEFMKGSQIVQAEALKSFIELFRSQKWRKTGIVWWNVIDCWPQFSDAVVDWYYVRKLAWYYIRNAQQPLLLSISDPADWTCRLTASNDRLEPAAGRYAVRDILSGEVFAEGAYQVEANAAREIAAFEVCRSDRRMLLVEWTNDAGAPGADGTRPVCRNHYLLGSPPFRLPDYLAWLRELDRLLYTNRREW